MNIRLDLREHGLRNSLSAVLTPQSLAHLPVGDIWIGLQPSDTDQQIQIAPNGLVIERKAAADLEASILDGRYREQRSRLLAACGQWKAHPVYIIEGDLDRLGARLTKSALLKHLTRLSLRYHVAVFQTDSLDETAYLVKLLAEQWAADPTTFEQPASLTYVETRGVERQAQSDDPKVFATSVLRCCRGISAAGAQAVLEGCGGTLSGVWKATAEELASIVVGKKRLGPAVAKRLHSLLHGDA